MFQNILTVGTYVFILFVLIFVGYISNKTKILTSESVKGMTSLILYVVTPCVIINSYQREFDPTMMKGLFITLLAAVLSFAVNILLAHLLVHDKDLRREKAMRFGAVFSNCGYMSLPLQQAMLGAEGVFYGATYVAIFQIMLWTYGVILMSGSIKNISAKNIFVNPGVIGTVLGVLVFVFSIKIPFVISEPIKYLASLNTPIPMVIVGFHLANANFNLRGQSAYVAILLRLIVSPLLMLLGLYLFEITGVILVSCVISTSAPFAAVTTMFSEKFDADTALSATTVSLTTLLSIITMPVVVGLAAVL